MAALLGCSTGRNYPDPDGPRYTGGTAVATGTGYKNATALRVVSFNIEYALRVDSAIAVLAGDPALRNLDLRRLLNRSPDRADAVIQAICGEDCVDFSRVSISGPIPL